MPRRMDRLRYNNTDIPKMMFCHQTSLSKKTAGSDVILPWLVCNRFEWCSHQKLTAPQFTWRRTKTTSSRWTREQLCGLDLGSIPTFTPTQTNCTSGANAPGSGPTRLNKASVNTPLDRKISSWLWLYTGPHHLPLSESVLQSCW